MIDNILYVAYNTNCVSKNANQNNETDKKGRVRL